MANNDFSKEERVAFEKLLEGFEDALILSRNISVFRTDQTMMERTADVIWRPMPYIVNSYAGTDQTGNFNPNTQLTVPSVIGFERAVPWSMTATELRDALQEDRLGAAARQRLASDINVAVMRVACEQGTIVVTKSSAASGFADVAAIEGAMNRVGIAGDARYLALSTGDYNALAADLAGRQNITDMTKAAYQRAYVGMIAMFETYKLDYALQQEAAAGGGSLTIDTRATAGNYWVPQATKVASTGQVANVDNRYQQVTISSTTGVRAGDCFTIAGVNEAHHITKLDTGSLKTFRVISVDSSTTMTISPPIISNQGGSNAELQYQNCIVTTSATAAIVFLNTVKKAINPFWHRDAIELMPGRYAVPQNAGAAVMRSTTEQGIEIVMTKQYDIKTMKTFYRLDVRYGVTMVQPEMAGIALFSQT